MANLIEVLVTSDSSNTQWTCSIWDPNNGTNLMMYKCGGNAEPRTLNFIGTDYLAVAEKAKPLLHIWPLNSQQTVQGMRFVLPGKATAVAFSKDGFYCVAGIDEKIFLWQIASGNLLTIITRHYQKVVLLKFTADGRYFVSAAEDGMVMVWSLATVAAHPDVELVTQRIAGQHDPIHIFTDHSLPVTDLCISKMGMSGRLITVSSDHTCKIYDLNKGEMLLNLVFDVPLLSVNLDVLELNVFVGTNEGKIHQFSLTHVPRTRDLCITNDEISPTFIGHTKGVTCLSVSLDGEILMSGSNDESVILWHIQSRQPLRTIRHKGAITNAFFTLNMSSIYNQDFSPKIILHNLHRTLEKDTEDITEIEVLCRGESGFWPKKMDDDSNINIITAEPKNDTNNYNSKLKKELEHLKKINANLYAFSIQKALEPNLATNVNSKSKKKKGKKVNK